MKSFSQFINEGKTNRDPRGYDGKGYIGDVRSQVIEKMKQGLKLRAKTHGGRPSVEKQRRDGKRELQKLDF